jgi:peptidoglycan/xylan/chitin deacetylase (PgdA/CDA1 family)
VDSDGSEGLRLRGLPREPDAVKPERLPSRHLRLGAGSLVLAAACNAASGVGSGAPSVPASVPVAAGREALETDFAEQPSYLPDDTLALTFDDGPLSPYTDGVLNALHDAGARATFFVTTDDNGNDVDHSAVSQEILRRIVREGHGIGNHTVHHVSLRSIDPEAMEAEIGGVEKSVARVLGPSFGALTLFRSPYGEPYQDYFYNPADPVAATYPAVSRVVARHGVHIAWNVDTDDWKCTKGTDDENADCVFRQFREAVKTVGAPGARWGIVLMHCVNPQTPKALPRILDYVARNHFRLISVEDVLRARFGKSSAELVRR